MAISRMQEPRQLYGLGSFVRKITRPVKKAVKGIGKIAKSPIGKAALIAAAGTYGLGALGSGGFNPLAKGFFSKANLAKGLGTFFSTRNPLLFKAGKFNLGRAGLTASALGAALPFLAPGLLAPKEEEIEETDIVNTPESIALLNQRARDFYNYGDPDLMFMPQKQYVMKNFYAADGGIADLRPEYKDGGRIGFRIGSDEGKDASGREYDSPSAPTGFTGPPSQGFGGPPPISDDDDTLVTSLTPPSQKDVPQDPNLLFADVSKMDLAKKGVLKGAGYSYFDAKNMGLINPSMTEEEYKGIMEGTITEPTGRFAVKEGGLMDLGGLEMDFRAEGGFVPIGAKEKADDVPARLSKNEFVMTADAVRGAGNGSIKAGAQKMYNTMKELERRVV